MHACTTLRLFHSLPCCAEGHACALHCNAWKAEVGDAASSDHVGAQACVGKGPHGPLVVSARANLGGWLRRSQMLLRVSFIEPPRKADIRHRAGTKQRKECTFALLPKSQLPKKPGPHTHGSPAAAEMAHSESSPCWGIGACVAGMGSAWQGPRRPPAHCTVRGTRAGAGAGVRQGQEHGNRAQPREWKGNKSKSKSRKTRSDNPVPASVS